MAAVIIIVIIVIVVVATLPYTRSDQAIRH